MASNTGSASPSRPNPLITSARRDRESRLSLSVPPHAPHAPPVTSTASTTTSTPHSRHSGTPSGRGVPGGVGLVRDASGFFYPDDEALEMIETDKFSFEEAFIRRATCCQPNDMIIYALFLAIPFLFAFCWVLLPSIEFYTFSMLSGCFYLLSFLVWQAFFDMLLPGLSLWLYLLFLIIFIAGTCGLYASFKFTGVYTEKFVYLTVEAWGVLCELTCYAIHLLQSRVFHRSPEFAGGKDIGPEKTMGESSDGKVRLNVDALRNYTEDLEAKAHIERGTTFDDKLALYDQEDHHVYRYFYNIFCFVRRVDWNRKRYSSTYGVKAGWRILAWGFVFRVAMFGIWLYLQFFTDSFVTNDYSHKDRPLSLVLLVVFQISRIIVFQVMLALNEKLPQVKELKYFATFSVFVLFLMFYRNLFFSINAWWIVITISVITFIWQILFYPVQMSKWFYKLRYRRLKGWLSEHGWFWGKVGSIIAPDVTYKVYVTQLACEYYYEEIGTYVSIIAILIFFPGAKYSYNRDAYPQINELSDSDFLQLWLRYLYLFAAEAVSDFIIRCIIHFCIKVDPTHTGKGLTVLNYRTRFLFGAFMAYYMMCCYYSVIRLDNF